MQLPAIPSAIPDARREPVTEQPAFTIEIENLTRRFGNTTVLDQINLSIRAGEFFSLLGPSGCGKTTLLRIIGGLDAPDEGVVRLCGQDARSIPAHRRPVHTVFQSYALFPHLTVRENIAFGLEMRHVGRNEIESRVGKIMNLTQISSLAERKPAQLSGGQKQRVAVARAVVNEPKILLLDEPLAALDLKLRQELRDELLSLQRQLKITFVFVTHDQQEALVLSDRIAVMQAGKIEQIGESAAVYERPRTRFVAKFLGSCNVLEGTLVASADRQLTVRTASGDLRVDLTTNTGSLPQGGAFTLAIRPEKVHLCADAGDHAENQMPARVEKLVYNGSETEYFLRAGSTELRARVLNAKMGRQAWEEGQCVQVHLPAESIIVLED